MKPKPLDRPLVAEYSVHHWDILASRLDSLRSWRHVVHLYLQSVVEHGDVPPQQGHVPPSGGSVSHVSVSPVSPSSLTCGAAVPGEALLADAAPASLRLLTLSVQTPQTLAGPHRRPLQVAQRAVMSLPAVAAVRLRVQLRAHAVHAPGRRHAAESETERSLDSETSHVKLLVQSSCVKCNMGHGTCL